MSDATTMRALAHPLRISLMELLTLDGPMTATEAGERLGESPTTCSFHLRQLAKYGLVEEAGKAPGRNRPWRVPSMGMTVEAEEDPGANLAAEALERIVIERNLRRFQAYRDSRATYQKVWRDLASTGDYALCVTPDELEQIERDLAQVLLRFQGRLTDRSSRPDGARLIKVLQFIFPLELDNLMPDPPGGSDPLPR